MDVTWHFRPFNPGDTVNDPIERALFSQEAGTTDPAAAIVREAIQNSLDAKSDEADVVRVRFTLHDGATAPTRSEFKPLIADLKDHLSAEKSGVHESPVADPKVPLLVVEDYGTKGLIGDEEAWDPAHITGNAFYLFFRALGRSGKSGEQRGRWGVGKFVFPLASRANCWFGYTRQEGTRSGMVMGRSVLKTHVLDGKSWHPDGTWGVSRTDNHILPLRDTDPAANRVLAAMRLTPRTEPGLSVVVPWVREDISIESIAASVLREYFVPIIRNDLVVEVSQGGGETAVFDMSTVEAHVAKSGDHHLIDLVALARQEGVLRASQLTVLSEATVDGVAKWHDKVMSEEVRQLLVDRLDRQMPVLLRVPFTIKPRHGAVLLTHVDMLLKANPDLGAASPLMVREGITIPDAKTRRLSGFSMLILIDHAAIAELIGDAENPSHTQLQPGLLSEKYKQGSRVVAFLRELGANVVKALSGQQGEVDTSILANYFPVISEGNAQIPKPSKRPGKASPVPTLPPRNPPRYQLRSALGGFVVTNGKDEGSTVSELLLTAAYEVRKGNPLKKYRKYDFSFRNNTLDFECDGAAIADRGDNTLLIVPMESEFKISVSGFDTNRNLVVRITAR